MTIGLGHDPTVLSIAVQVGLHTLLVAGLAACARHWTEQRRLLIAGVAGLVVIGLVTVLFPSTLVSRHLVGVMHEGNGTLAVLGGEGIHAGDGWSTLTWLTAQGPVDIRDIVRLNIGLTAAATWIFFLLARVVLGTWLGAALLAWLFASDLGIMLGATSETPGPYAALLVVLGVMPAATRRWQGIATLGVITALAGLVRVELVLLGIVPIAVGSLVVALGDRFEVWQQRVLARASPGVIGFGLVALVVVSFFGQRLSGRIQWAFQALDPLEPVALSFPLWAGNSGGPLLAVLVAAGTLVTLLDPKRFLGFPVGVLLLFGVYASASHNVAWEMLRYGGLLDASMLVLALFGWPALRSWLDRMGLHPRLRGGLVAVGILAALAPRPHSFAVLGESHLLERSRQLEVRALLGLSDDHPSCVIAPRQAIDGNWHGLAVLGPVQRPYLFDEAHTLEHDCVLYVRGLDCHLPGADCSDWGSGDAVWSTVLPYRPYNDEREYGPHRTPIVLQAFTSP